MTDTITVVGNIATDPEHRTAGSVPVTSFRVATSERRPDAQGAWVDAHTNYYSVSAFRELGDHAFASLRKGDRVIVRGKLRLKEWTGADGNRGRSIEIDADSLGHDLKFGSTVFRRGARPDGSTAAPEAPRDDGWSSPDEAWGAPGVADGAATHSAEGDDGRVDEPGDSGGESLGARSLSLVGADTPF